MALDYKCPNCGRALGYKGLCWVCRAEEERNTVLAWTEQEMREKIAYLIENAEKLKEWGSKEYNTACRLIDYRGICPPELSWAAWKAGAFSLAKIYYRAPADVRDGLIKSLMETEDAHLAGKLMECLAMQGDDQALAVLYELERHPKPWRNRLYVDPSVYAQAGGWTFDKQGQRRTLNFDTCYPMVKGGKKMDSPVRIGRIRKDICPQCGGKMMDMLTVDGRDERLRFLGVNGIITAVCCPNCVAFTEGSFSHFTLDGGSTPLPPKGFFGTAEDDMGEEGRKQIENNPYVLGESPVPPFYESESDFVNTIGGFASWVQDWIYMKCPDCGKPMKYLGQIHWDSLVDGDGTLYIEFCPDCQNTAIHHQQT